MTDKYFDMKKQVDDRKKRQDEAYKDNSKKRLLINIEKKFKTTMIGALSKFEAIFGYLWGHDKDGPLTKLELEMKRKWEEARTQILDNGNNNLRAAQQEIAQYTLSWNRYRTEFIVKQNQSKEDPWYLQEEEREIENDNY